MSTNILNESFLTQAEEVLKSVKFPSQPQILMDIQQEINKPEPVFKNIAQLLSRDIALTAKILKIVNSPFYATPREIQSPRHALALLGLKNFSNVVLASSMQDAMQSPNMPPKEFNLFFKHSLQTANIAQMLAKAIVPGNLEQQSMAYMAGLFHDCGIPILAKKYPDYFEKILPHFTEGKALDLAEEEVYTTNHGVVGSLIANMWKMPLLVRQVIFHHHQEDFSFHDNEDLVELISIVMLSEKIIAEMQPNDERSEPKIYQSTVSEDCFKRIMNNLNLSTEHLSILEKNAQEFAAIDQ